MKQFPLLVAVAVLLISPIGMQAQPPAPPPAGPIRDGIPVNRAQEEPPVDRNVKDLIQFLNDPTRLQDLSSPEAVVRAFVTALNDSDIKRAAACVQGAEKNVDATTFQNILDKMDIKQLALAGWTSNSHILISDLRTYRQWDDGFRATATLLLTNVTVAGQQVVWPLRTSVERLYLVTERGLWKIAPTAPLAQIQKQAVRADQVAPPENDLLAFAATLLAGKEGLKAAKEQDSLHACQMNLKQLGLGAMQFVQDFDGKFAFNAADYKKSLLPYVRSERIFYCPTDETGKVSYSFNANLENMSQGDIKNPAEIVMIYEGHDGELDFRHNDSANIAFADGHVKLITREAAKALNWKP